MQIPESARRSQEVPADEHINQLTHGAGLALSVVGAWHLLARVPVPTNLMPAVWVYVIALIALYAASTLSHSFVSEDKRRRWRTLDQICIFTVMAGTYTPMSLAVCSDGWWNLPLVLMWGLAGVGIFLKLRVTGDEMVPVWFYVIVASIPIIALPRILQYAGPGGFAWITAGGACYLLGVVFLTNDRKAPYLHAVWHVLVIMGSICHYIVIHEYAARVS